MRAVAVRMWSKISAPVIIFSWLMFSGAILSLGGDYRWSDIGLIVLPLFGIAAVGSFEAARHGLVLGVCGLAAFGIFSVLEPGWMNGFEAGERVQALARQISDILSFVVYGSAFALGLLWIIESEKIYGATRFRDHPKTAKKRSTPEPDLADIVIVSCSKSGEIVDIRGSAGSWPGLHVGARAQDVLIDHAGRPLRDGSYRLASGQTARAQTLCADGINIMVIIMGPFATGTQDGANQAGLGGSGARTAEAASKLVQLAGLGHDLRSPLSTVLGLAQAMESGALGAMPHGYTEYPGMILDRGRTMMRLIDDMLLYMRSDSDSLNLELQPVSLGASAQEARQAFDAEATRIGLDLTLEIVSDGTVMADPFALQRIWGNLLSNAMSVSDAGDAIHLKIYCNGGAVSMSVRDNGPGLDPNALSWLSEPFQQGAKRSWSSGTGLGLAIVAVLARQQGGVLGVEKHPAGGSIFSIRFPLLQSGERSEGVSRV